MHIGVVIPAYNAAPWISDAIASVLAQTHADWRLVVVDDGSTDGTGIVALRFADRRVRLIRQANSGVSIARNRGVRELAADAVLFLDADDSLAPDALSRLAAALEASPAAVAAVGRSFMAGSRPTGRVAGHLLPRLLVRNLFANGGQVLIRANAVGDFDTNLSYGEDWEFWVRLALKGPFAAARGKAPVLFVRRHASGAYRRLAIDPASFKPCMDAIFSNPTLLARYGASRLARMRRRAEVENAWIVGRELVRNGAGNKGWAWLWRSFRAAPSIKRAVLLAMAPLRLGPLSPYDRASFACNEPTSPCGKNIMNRTSNVP